MSVVKVKIQKHFTTLYNGTLENKNLSFKAKGLWAYCMSKSEDWQFHVNHLATISKDGKDAIYSALKELEAEGMVEKVQINENGKFGPVDYVIYPYPKEIQKILPLRDLPQTGNPQTVNPPLPSTEEQYQEITSHQRGGEVIPDGKKSDSYIGTLQERVDFLKQIFFPGGKTISQRNIESWSRNYSLWRLMKASVKNVHMIEDGKVLENPEAYFAKMLKDPYMESTQDIEILRSDLYAWIRNKGKFWRVDNDFVVASELDKELSFQMGYQRIVEEMERWLNEYV